MEKSPFLSPRQLVAPQLERTHMPGDHSYHAAGDGVPRMNQLEEGIAAAQNSRDSFLPGPQLLPRTMDIPCPSSPRYSSPIPATPRQVRVVQQSPVSSTRTAAPRTTSPVAKVTCP